MLFLRIYFGLRHHLELYHRSKCLFSSPFSHDEAPCCCDEAACLPQATSGERGQQQGVGVKTVKKTIMKKNTTFARLTPAARNRIIGMRLAGAERQRIRDTIRKSDGSSPCLQAVDAVLAHHQADPVWDGSNSVAGGRPRSLEPKMEKVILRILQRDVGKFVVCFMEICTCSCTGGILAQASHVPRGPSQCPLILQFTN